MTHFLTTCITVMATAGVVNAWQVTVEAGDVDRRHTPTFFDVEDDGLHSRVAVCGATASPAQIEPLEEGRARIWWIMPELAAGTEQACHIVSGELQPTEADGFRWQDSSDGDVRSRDLLFGDQPVLRYMHTPFNPEDIEHTKKPYHHVFDPLGDRPITKGAGGLYSHHRGIFFGYNKCRVNDSEQELDTWHAARGEHQLHRETIREFNGPVFGGHIVRIDWNDRQGRPFVEETRRVIAFRPANGQVLIEVASTLRSTRGTVMLDGDRQHAGLQFRAAQSVADNKEASRFLRPARWADLPPEQEVNAEDYRGLPWNALRFPMDQRTYTVAYLSDPANPRDAEFSERLYGRFGEFFPWKLEQDRPLSIRYRFWIDATGDVDRETIERCYRDLASPPRVHRN